MRVAGVHVRDVDVLGCGVCAYAYTCAHALLVLRRRLEIIRAATEGGWLHDEGDGIKRLDEPLSATASEEMYRVSIHSSEADDVRVRDQP